jgi:hypothetical protein
MSLKKFMFHTKNACQIFLAQIYGDHIAVYVITSTGGGGAGALSEH